MARLRRRNCFAAMFTLSAGLALLAFPGLGQQLPAVSAPNAKLDFNAGVLTGPLSLFSSAAGAFTVPIGQYFGLQIDAAGFQKSGSFGFGGAIHVFTRDPARGLLGGTVGFVRLNGAMLTAAGPEAEFYWDRASVEAWGGLAGLAYDPPSMPARLGAFIMADLAYYPHDDLRLSLGGASILGYNSLHLGAEYLWRNTQLPLAFTADARFGQDGAITALAGIRIYFGDPGKSLLARHRQDDPPNLGVDFAGAVGPLLVTPIPSDQAGASEGPLVCNPGESPNDDGTACSPSILF